MDVGDFIRERGLADKDVVAAIQRDYPKYDKSLNSKVKKPELYGIRLVTGAEEILYGLALKVRCKAVKQDRHKLTDRVSCRLPKRIKRRLLHSFKKRGWDTVQIGMENLISKFLLEEAQRNGNVQ